jgi:hypothetical protein
MTRQFPEEAELNLAADKLGEATLLLATKQQELEQRLLELVARRVTLKWTDWTADRVARGVLNAAEAHDGKKGGPMAAEVAPNGITPIVKPLGSKEVAELRKLELRLTALTGRWEAAAAQLALVVRAREAYEAALSAREEGYSAVGLARAQRDLAKEDFLDAFAEFSGRVKTRFPRDREMQQMFFDSERESSGVSKDDDDSEPEN